MYHRLLRQALSHVVEAEGTRFDVRSLKTVEQSRLSSGVRLSCRLLYRHVPPRLLTQSLEWRLLIVPSRLFHTLELITLVSDPTSLGGVRGMSVIFSL